MSLLSPRQVQAASGAGRLRRWLLVLGGLLLVLVALVGTQSGRVWLGAQAYVYGYPLVIMDVTRQHASQTAGPENELRRVRRFPDARFKAVVRPNVDTLYTTAFIDMVQGPWLFEMAPNGQRYELMPFMDAWTNVFATPGTRTTGTAGGRYLLVGPNWTGTPPEGLTVLRSPTRMVWLVGRTQTNGVNDYPLVHRLQDGLSLRRWPEAAAAAASSAPPVTAPLLASTVDSVLPPLAQMQRMSTEAFFVRLAQLMVDNPPTAADAPMLTTLAQLGVQPGQAMQWGLLQRWSMAVGRWLADRQLAKEAKSPRLLVRGWATPPALLGQYGTEYGLRAVVARVGLGANLPADAIYPNTRVDARGDALNGSRRYRIHFKANELPPTRAFWSITAYGADEFLIDQPTGRFALGDRDPLVFNADGSLDLWIQAHEPAAAQRANWLPVAAGQPFMLNARLYWPKASALSGAWGMPAVERAD